MKEFPKLLPKLWSFVYSLFILMNSSIDIDIMNLGWFIVHIKMYQEFPNFDEVKPQSLKIVIIVANCADPDEMLHSAEIHLGLHCLLKYL